jgi:nitroimidazol reductase NimA-like FMN-containing flavoprotein (pyridoxamine 5'-phosphate oxidase superfamily)
MTSYGTDVLTPDECRELLATQQVGRVAVDTGEYPAILPVLYALLDGDVVFRTGPGNKLVAAARHRTIAFEADAFDVERKAGWSVDVVGPAEELVAPHDIERAEALGLEPWAGTFHDRFVRIRAEHITGRRVGAHASASAPAPAP